MDIILTAAISLNGKIARHSEDLITWSKDLWLFREQTMGQTVIMGSNTAKLLEKELVGRHVIIFHRDMIPEDVLKTVHTEKCFIAGGSRTNANFSEYLTHLFLTIHPLVLPNSSLPLFFELDRTFDLFFERKVEVDKESGIYQFQYKILG